MKLHQVIIDWNRYLSMLTDTVFSRAMYYTSTYGAANAGGEGVEFAANYKVINDGMIVSSASVVLDTATTIGSVIQFVLYTWTLQQMRELKY